MSGPTVTDTELQLALAAFRAQARSSPFSWELGIGMQYFVWGSGPPIVFIHGMSDRARAFAMVMHHLIERYTCVAYELPDGTTDGSELRRYIHKDYVADLMELLDHLGLATTAVLGSSFGSTIALAAMANTPRRFTHGILQGGIRSSTTDLLSQRVLSSALPCSLLVRMVCGLRPGLYQRGNEVG